MILNLDIAQPKTTELQFYDNTPVNEDKDGYEDGSNPAKASVTFWALGLFYKGPEAAWSGYSYLTGTSVIPIGIKSAGMEDFGGSLGAKFPDGWYEFRYMIGIGSAITNGSLTNGRKYVAAADSTILDGVTPTDYSKGDTFIAGNATVVDSGTVYECAGVLDDSMLLLGQLNGYYLYYLSTFDNKDLLARQKFKELYRDFRTSLDAAKALHLTGSYTNCLKRVQEVSDIIVSIKSLC